LIGSAYRLMYVREKKGVSFQPLISVEEKFSLGRL
jgi:hypothetical protein